MPARPITSSGTLHLGDFHPDLEAAFAARLRALCPGGDARGLLVLTPNRLLGVHLRRRAAQLGVGTLGLQPRALEDFTTELAMPHLAARGWRVVDGWTLPLLVAEILARPLAASSSYFANSAGRPGLYRALAATFRDLRDAGVGPEALVVAAAGVSPKVEQVADLYQRFVSRLKRRRLADSAAVGEAAAAVLSGSWSPPAAVLLYGFYDLVGRQRQVLAALLDGRCAEVFFPWGDNPAFAYAAPLRDWFLSCGLAPETATGTELLAAYPELSGPGRVESDVPLPADLASLRQGLFVDRPTPSPRDGSVRLLSAPTAAREAIEVLRRMVHAPTRSAAVLLRQDGEELALWSGARRASGVPLHLGAGQPWQRRPAGRATLLLLNLAAGRRPNQGETLARSEVEDLLATGALAPDLVGIGSRPERWTQILRRRGLVGGLEGWELLRASARVDGQRGESSAGASRGGEDDERDPRLRHELPALAAFVERLLDDTARLAADASSWANFWQRLRAMVESWLVAGSERDGLLMALAPLARLDGVVPFAWDSARASAEGLLGEAGPAWVEGIDQRFGSAPTVAGLLSLRGLTFERVVIPALVERSFPRRGRHDPILLDDERGTLNDRLRDRPNDGLDDGPRGDLGDRLGSASIPLKLAAVAAEERLLFRLAVGAARQELWLSWPRQAADGRRVVPSSFALAAGRALLGREVLFEDLERASGDLRVELAPLSLLAGAGVRKPAGSEPGLPPLLAWEFDFEEIARVAKAPHRARATPELSYLLQVYPGLARTIEADRHRHGAGTRHRLTAWDGLVGPSLAAAWFARRQTASGAFRISASALERYAQCSFQFFHEQVLGLASAPQPERRLDLDPLAVGALVHRLLERLYDSLAVAHLLPLQPSRLAAARALVEPALEAVVAESPSLVGEAPPALWRVRRRRLIADLQDLLEREARAERSWLPLHREWAFGLRGEPLVEVDVAGERLALRGRLDRLDVAAGDPGRLRVVDYKTGRLDRKQTPEPPDLHGGRRLQLPLYRLAAAALAERLPESIEAAYVGVERQSGFREVSWRAADFAAAAPEFGTIVGAMLAGLRAGEFFQVERGDHCDEQCAFREICGPGRTALIDAKSDDQRVAAARAWRGENGR